MELRAIYSDGFSEIQGTVMTVQKMNSKDEWSWVFKSDADEKYYANNNGEYFRTQEQAIEDAVLEGLYIQRNRND